MMSKNECVCRACVPVVVVGPHVLALVALLVGAAAGKLWGLWP